VNKLQEIIGAIQDEIDDHESCFEAKLGVVIDGD